MPEPGFQPSGACSGCPYRTRCHESRQHAMDVLGAGRHTICEFYLAFRRQEAAAAARQPSKLATWLELGTRFRSGS